MGGTTPLFSKNWPQSAFQNRLTKTTATHHDKAHMVETKIFTHRLSQMQQCTTVHLGPQDSKQ